MHNLSVALHYYIADRLQSVPAWKGIKVIFSDAKVPGEGEHKIMRFMRNQRAQPGYNPNTSHALYGMDADLIMLGLATHDPYSASSERQYSKRPGGVSCAGQTGHYMDQVCSQHIASITPTRPARLLFSLSVALLFSCSFSARAKLNNPLRCTRR